MRRNGPNWPLTLGLLLSVVVHVALLVPLLVVLMTTRQARPALQARFDPDAFRRPAEDPDPEEDEPTRLGIDDGAPSSMTWIGYDTYQEHLARLAEFEQAAFTDADRDAEVSGGLPAPAVADGTDPAAQPPTLQTPQPAAAAPTNAAEENAETEPQPEPQAERAAAAGTPDDPMQAGAPAPIELAPGTAIGAAEDPAALVPSGDDGAPLVPDVLADAAGPSAAGDPEAEGAATSAPDPSPLAASLVRRLLEQVQRAAAAAQAESGTTPAEPTEPVVAAATPPPDVSSPGEGADRESDPTSTVDVPMDRIKAGRPIAAAGLELMPRRPDFTMVTLLTASPCNPLVSIQFKKDGRPVVASIVETSCDDRVDQAVLSSLYRWRAKGEPLAQLGTEDTIEVRIRIVLTRK